MAPTVILLLVGVCLASSDIEVINAALKREGRAYAGLSEGISVASAGYRVAQGALGHFHKFCSSAHSYADNGGEGVEGMLAILQSLNRSESDTLDSLCVWITGNYQAVGFFEVEDFLTQQREFFSRELARLSAVRITTLVPAILSLIDQRAKLYNVSSTDDDGQQVRFRAMSESLLRVLPSLLLVDLESTGLRVSKVVPIASVRSLLFGFVSGADDPSDFEAQLRQLLAGLVLECSSDPIRLSAEIVQSVVAETNALSLLVLERNESASF